VATIYIDGKAYPADPAHNLLHVCLSLGLDLPYFCWHPALGSVGACRQCAVKQFKDAGDTQGRVVMACMTPAEDGTRISIEDREARAFRESVIEWLMANHPHDCPVCDEGGECHLQDMTVMTGHTYRRHRFKKRTFRNQYLGPFINHEMNRCIQCYRCVRFYRDYAGGRDLHAFAAHDHVYFGRHQDGVLESGFSGNLVEVCPTGVFTDKTLRRHYTRKWDLQTAPSICVHCGIGCNTIVGERYGGIRRILNRYNGEVNGYFLCDRGRFGYEFVNDSRRIRQCYRRRAPGEQPEPITRDVAVGEIAALLAPGGRAIGIGSPRASLEANFALRALVGADRFSVGMSRRERDLAATALAALRDGPARTPTLREVELADAVLVLGEDVTNTAPMLALAVRQAVRQQPLREADRLGVPRWHDAAVRDVVQDARGPLFIVTPSHTRLDEVAVETCRAAPAEIARLGFSVAHELDPRAPSVPDLSGTSRALAGRIARALLEAQRPLVVSGMGCGSQSVIEAAANVAWALRGVGRPAELCLAVPECNTLGLSMLGGLSLEEVWDLVQRGAADVVIVLENDLYRRADRASVERAMGAARHVIVIDHLENRTTARASLVLPAATFAEGDGTLVNNEGRAQRFVQVFVAEGDVQESWRWLSDVMTAGGHPDAAGWAVLDDVVSALAAAIPALRAISGIAPPARSRIAGQKIPRQTVRFSGRTAMHADRTVHEPKPPEDPDSPLCFSMEGYPGRPPSAVIPFFWAPGWNSAQATNKFQEEVRGPLQGGDPGRRLLEAGDVGPLYFDRVPVPLAPLGGERLIVPLHHIFGTDELSARAPAVRERSPEPYLALRPEDAVSLGAAAGDAVELRLEGRRDLLPVVICPSLCDGSAGLPAGLPGLEGIELPARGTVARAS
jgi:NADH-quinone oxidoreductase subunit G